VLGGTPLVPSDTSPHIELFRSILDHFPDLDAIYLPNVRSDTFCWRFLRESRELRSEMLIYPPEGICPFHTIQLAPTFAEYLSKFKTDTRKKLQRKVRRLRDHGRGHLKLVRVDSVGDVDSFLDAALAISKHTWQERVLGMEIDTRPRQRIFLRACARSGILRSYLLRCGDEYCAFGLGYLFQGTFHLTQIGYDERWGRLSPGTVQFFLLLEDLIESRSAQRLDFGHGDWAFKRLFGTHTVDQASVLLMRREVRSALRIATHSTFYGLVRPLKRMLRRRDFVRGG